MIDHQPIRYLFAETISDTYASLRQTTERYLMIWMTQAVPQYLHPRSPQRHWSHRNRLEGWLRLQCRYRWLLVAPRQEWVIYGVRASRVVEGNVVSEAYWTGDAVLYGKAMSRIEYWVQGAIREGDAPDLETVEFLCHDWTTFHQYLIKITS